MTVIPLHPDGPPPEPPSPEGALVSPRGERRDAGPLRAPTRVTVVGDALLDIDIRGEVERIEVSAPSELPPLPAAGAFGAAGAAGAMTARGTWGPGSPCTWCGAHRRWGLAHRVR